MVAAIRNIEQALGDGIKRPSPSESKNIAIARKSIHLAANLPKGHVITWDDLVVKRPGDGIPSSEMENIVGRKFNRDVHEDDMLQWGFFD
jgi:sialic acid synthase SpsE